MADLSPTAMRTRNSIITASIGLLSSRPEAPMTDVAETAGVSRSTLHRYFPDRDALTDALNDHAADHWRRTVREARLGEDSGLEAFRRLCGGLLDSRDVLVWWASQPELSDDVSAEGWDAILTVMDEAPILAVIERGKRDGSIDSDIHPTWLFNVLWAILGTTVFPDNGLSAAEVQEQALRTLMKLAAA